MLFQPHNASPIIISHKSAPRPTFRESITHRSLAIHLGDLILSPTFGAHRSPKVVPPLLVPLQPLLFEFFHPPALLRSIPRRLRFQPRNLLLCMLHEGTERPGADLEGGAQGPVGELNQTLHPAAERRYECYGDEKG